MSIGIGWSPAGILVTRLYSTQTFCSYHIMLMKLFLSISFHDDLIMVGRWSWQKQINLVVISKHSLHINARPYTSAFICNMSKNARRISAKCNAPSVPFLKSQLIEFALQKRDEESASCIEKTKYTCEERPKLALLLWNKLLSLFFCYQEIKKRIEPPNIWWWLMHESTLTQVKKTK